jgi:hypothetical protein
VAQSIINRYYDPSTDQFLSIDSDVAQTDQPYVFTSDNPLNAEDPLGTNASFSGSAWDIAFSEGPGPIESGNTSGPIPMVWGDDLGGITQMADGYSGTGGPPAAGPGSEGTGSSGEYIPGLSSDYKDATYKGSIENVETNVTPQEFGDNLKDAGWNEAPSKDGKATIYTKDGSKYSVYPTSTSTGGPTAEFTPAGSTTGYTLKIRLGR